MSRSASLAAPRRRSRSFGWLALAAAILGLISVPVVPIIFVIGMISIIGIPLALAVVPIPTICMAVVIAYVLWRFFLFRAPMGVPLSFVGALAVLVLVPLVHNFIVTSDVRALRAGDMSGQVAPLGREETLVMFRSGRTGAYCDEVCLDFLLSGRIKAFATGGVPRGQSVPSPDAEILVHHLSRTPSCEKRLIFLPNEDWKKTQPGTVANALAAAERRGVCVDTIEAFADKLVAPRFVALLDDDNLDFSESTLFIETFITPWRVAFYERMLDGVLAPVFQDTKVSSSLLRPLLAYHLSMGEISHVKPRWWRTSHNAKRPEIRDYLTRVLGVQFRYKVI